MKHFTKEGFLMKKLMVALIAGFMFSAPVMALDLTYDIPTYYTDGTPIGAGEVVKGNLYADCGGGVVLHDSAFDLDGTWNGAPAAREIDCAYQVSAVSELGKESPLSVALVLNTPNPTPNAPTNLAEAVGG